MVPSLSSTNVLPETDYEGFEVERESTARPQEAIVHPFDPTKIRVAAWSPTIQLLTDRMRLGEIQLHPEFQRSGGIWSDQGQSRLIESLLIRIPLPAFYFDATDEEKMGVIDGQQRLHALKRFIVDHELVLTGLEFLTEFNGRQFKELPRPFQRRILESQVTVFLIEKGTPAKVKYTIFKRINTGGLPLSSQEIRHALNQGPASELLKTLAESEEFRRATDWSVPAKRMVDRECVLRFLAFVLSDWKGYETRDLDRFLHDAMERLNKLDTKQRSDLSHRFKRAMEAAHAIFDKFAFRKRYREDGARYPINKALFEAWSVNLDACSDEQLAQLTHRKEQVQVAFMARMSSDREFESSVSVGTGDPKNVKKRFQVVAEILAGVRQ
jgi:hypothetical protein